MSTNLPRRVVRITSLQRQCLFQRHHNASARTPISAHTSRAFSSTPPQCRAPRANDRNMTKVAAEQISSRAPRVTFSEMARDTASMADDIGLLQDTMIRAPFSKLPSPWKRAFWSYWWSMVRSKGTGLYSRSSYNRMKRFAKGMMSYLPVDTGNNRQLKTYAKRYYEQIYQAYARGDIKTIQRFCLPALAKDFEQRILARPSDLQIVWTFDEKRCSASVVSHRVAALGEENPNTAYRQAVIRLRSKQSLVTKKSSVSESQSQEKTVVEYIVLQKRIVSGNEDDDWKVQGFAEESTPEKMEEDAEYWRQTLAAQVNTMG